MAISGIGITPVERQEIAACKAQLTRNLKRLLDRYTPPITVAAMAEFTAELSFVIAGPQLTVVLFDELSRQISVHLEK